MNENAIAALYTLYLSDGPQTTTDVAEAVFDPQGTEAARNAERKVRYYFEDGYAHLTEPVEGDGAVEYRLREECIWFGVGQVRMVTLDGEEVEVGIGDALVYITAEGEPETVSIEYDDPPAAYTDPETDF
jgi:hypothetical protein